MNKKYRLKVNDSFEFQFLDEEISSLDVQQISPLKFHVLQNNASFKSKIIASNFLQKTYSVKINSNIYDVKISNELDVLIDEMGLSLGTAQVANDIKAPMPGLILDVNVKKGDEVKEGDYLLVLEAMKMENTLTATRDGVVKSVTVKKGQSVSKNELLIEME